MFAFFCSPSASETDTIQWIHAAADPVHSISALRKQTPQKQRSVNTSGRQDTPEQLTDGQLVDNLLVENIGPKII